MTYLLLKYERIYEEFELIKDVIFTNKIKEEMIHKYLAFYAELVYFASKNVHTKTNHKITKIKIKLTNQNQIEKKSRNTLEILNFFYRKLNCYSNPKEQFFFNLKFDILRKLMKKRKNELFLNEIKFQSLLISNKNSKLYEFYPILYEFMDNDQFTEFIKNVMMIDNKIPYSLISYEELNAIKNRFCDYDFKSFSKLNITVLSFTLSYMLNFSLFNLLKLKKF